MILVDDEIIHEYHPFFHKVLWRLSWCTNH
jgi:hypothetical protein